MIKRLFEMGSTIFIVITSSFLAYIYFSTDTDNAVGY